MKTLLLLLLSTALSASAQRIVYTKVFPKSKPDYVKIALDKSGAATYQEATDEPEPEKFQLDSSAVTAVFALADKLDHFKPTLESGMKVARTGDKTYRWEDGAATSEATYNHTTNDDARALQDWFERITECQRILAELQRTLRFDRLGVNDAVLRLDAVVQQKRIVAPRQFIPILDRISKNESILNMARDRAANLSDTFKAWPQ